VKEWDFTPQKVLDNHTGILESEGEVVVVQRMPKGCAKEQSLWRIVHVLEQLVGEQVGFHEEMAKI